MNDRMKTHVQIVAWINIISGALGVMVGMLLFSLLTGIGISVNDPDANTALPIIGTVLGYVLVISSAPEIIAGIFLLKFKNWARYLSIVLAILNLFVFPIGTAIGVYSLWVLFNQDTVRMFEEYEAARSHSMG